MIERNPFESEKVNPVSKESIAMMIGQIKRLSIGQAIEVHTNLSVDSVKLIMKRIGKFIVKKSEVDGSIWVKRVKGESVTSQIEELIDSDGYYNYMPIEIGSRGVNCTRSIVNNIAKKRMYEKIKTKISPDKKYLLIKIVP